MKRLSIFASVIVVGFGVVSGFHGNSRSNFQNATMNVAQVADGAFRDGLYLGKLAGERGVESHAPIGRWARAEDRASFKAGYQRGYNESASSHSALATR